MSNDYANPSTGNGAGIGNPTSTSTARNLADPSQFMGGVASATVSSNINDKTGTSSIMSSNQNQYSDPGMIVAKQQGQGQGSSDDMNMNMTNNNNNNDITNDSNNNTGAGIVISAEDIKKEIENGDYTGEGSNNDGKGSYAISSLFHKTANVIEKSQNVHNAALETQVIEQHRENLRRYKGYPPPKDGTGTGVGTGVGTGTEAAATTTAGINGKVHAHAQPTLHPEPCVGGKFLIMKLRNWRTGYERILSLHNSYFTTIDPETYEITNMWKYTQVKQYMSLPSEEDCLLIEVTDENGRGSTKLKFKCVPKNLPNVLTAFATCKYLYDTNIMSRGMNSNNYHQQRQMQSQNPMFECQRQTKYNTRMNTLLVCAPHGLVEIDAKTRSVTIQTYLYKNLKAVCFISDEMSGVVLYMGGMKSVPLDCGVICPRNANSVVDPTKNGESICEEKVFFVAPARVGGSGRSDLITVLKNKLEVLGLSIVIAESVTLNTLLQRKMHKGDFVGGQIGMFQVVKFSQRRQCYQSEMGATGNNTGHVLRNLVITQDAFLMECENGKVVNCRKLRNISGLVRHRSNDQKNMSDATNANKSFTIEFKDGTSRTYYSSERDIVLVSLLDVIVNLCRNFNVTVTDVSSLGYSLSSLETSEFGFSKRIDAGMFLSEPIEEQCLKRVHNVASNTNSYLQISLTSGISQSESIDECYAVVEVCHEFNVNVSLIGILNLPKDERFIVATIHDLWGIASHLLTFGYENKSTGKPVIESETGISYNSSKDVDCALCTIFQTLYRLMMTPSGYSNTAKDKDAMNVFATKASRINDEFTLYWLMKCASTLVLPRPFADREKDVETTVKNQVLYHIPYLTDLLVSKKEYSGENFESMRSSPLIQMVVSNIFESVLCSHEDTTTPRDFSALVDGLSDGYQSLMSLLQSNASIIIENTVLLLHILTTHSPQSNIRIREVALNSGILLQHFYSAVFSSLEGQRFLSRHLCALWFSGPPDSAEKNLLKRMIPAGFLPYLAMPILSEAEEEQLDEIGKGNGKEKGKEKPEKKVASNGAGTNTARLRQRIKIVTAKTDGQKKANENFRIFFHVLEEDHSLPDLIWNQQTRHELKSVIELELKFIDEQTKINGGIEKIAWNHQQFMVPYSCLKSEVRVGTIYMRLWLQTGDSFIKSWNNPLRLFELLFRRLLCDLDRDNEVTNMCICCLERLYTIHALKIGPFPDIMILMQSMVKTRCIETQHRLLGLITALMGGTKSQSKDNKVTNVAANAEQLMNDECISYLCHFIAWGHLHSEQFDSGVENTISDKTSNVPAMWYIAPPGKIPPLPESIEGPFFVKDLRDLFAKGVVLPQSLVTTSIVNDYSQTHASPVLKDSCLEKGNWRILDEVWQLRWQLLTDHNLSPCVHSPSKIASMALSCLNSIVSVHQSVDSRGIPFFPIPVAKRLICGQSGGSDPVGKATNKPNLKKQSLSIICQAFLCNDSDVVETAADLITKIMDHNEEACAKLYLTGIFYFALLYTGSNFRPIAQLIYETHMKQKFYNTTSNDIIVEDRSILENMLPEGLLKVLSNHGAEKFTDVFKGDFDTPEVIWSPEMRKNLMMMIKEHLGNFPLRLCDHSTEIYEYCPIPRISFGRLQEELFCHNFYLNNLCNEQRFPDWPIAEPYKVFHACLEKWKEIILHSNDNDQNNLEEARKLMDLSSGYNANDLRKAYRALIRKYNEEKDHHDWESLEKVKSAYEHLAQHLIEDENTQKSINPKLNSLVEEEDVNGLNIGSLQFHQIHLLMKTQLLVCKRYPDELGEHKYPSYQLLLSCLNFPSPESNLHGNDILESCLLRENRSKFVRTAIDLIFNTCLVSPLNAEELIRENGLVALDSMLDFYIQALSVLTQDIPEEELMREKREAQSNLITEIVIHIVHTISGVVYFENGRLALLSLDDPYRLCMNWRRCLDLRFLHHKPHGCNMLKRYALEGIASMSKNEQLQKALTGCHIVWSLLSSMLGFDPSIATSPMAEHLEPTMTQAEINFQAFLATRALGMLCGVMKDDLATTSNGVLCTAMKNVLTQPLARMLSNSESAELLQTLNLNVESPVRLWDATMRSELVAFVEEMESKSQHQDIEDALEASNSFEYSNLLDEVNIGGVYIRIFNKMNVREAIRDLPDSSHFTQSLLHFIQRSIHKSFDKEDSLTNETTSAMDEDNHWYPIADNRFLMAVRSVLHLVQLDGVVDDVMCEREGIEVLFSLLELPRNNEAYNLGHDILLFMSPKKSFADAISNLNSILRRLVSRLEFYESGLSSNCDEDVNQVIEPQEEIISRQWAILESLASTTSVAKVLVASSVWLELLGVITGYSKFTKALVGRQGAAKTLFRLLWDPSTSPIAGSLLQRFLPPGILIILKEKGPESMLQAFDDDCETAELIWDSSLRTELRIAVTEQLDPIVCANGDTANLNSFALDSMFSMKYNKLKHELYIGGVYVRNFLKEPTSQLRDSSGFLEMLLIRWSETLKLLTESNIDSEQSQNNNSITVTDQNTLEDITRACISLCSHSYLCVKLASWGYMKHAIMFLHKAIAKDLLDVPLMSCIRLLHIAASERVNIESITSICDPDGNYGVVDGIMKAVGSGKLHPDSGFMLETLKIIITDALGDVEKYASNLNGKLPQHTTSSSYNSELQDFAPSPAPGTEPVKKMKNFAGEDPLSMLLGDGTPTPAPTPGISSSHTQTSVQSKHAVKPVRNQINTMSRGQNNTISGSLQKTPQLQTAHPNYNLISRNDTVSGNFQQQGSGNIPIQRTPIVPAPVYGQHGMNQQYAVSRSQSNVAINPLQNPSSQLQTGTSNTNFNPNTVRKANSQQPTSGLISTQYKHALPASHRGVRPVRNQPGNQPRVAQSNPLQNPIAKLHSNAATRNQNNAVNPSLHHTGRYSTSTVSSQNNQARQIYGQRGVEPTRNQSGMVTRDQNTIAADPLTNPSSLMHQTTSNTSNTQPNNMSGQNLYYRNRNTSKAQFQAPRDQINHSAPIYGQRPNTNINNIHNNNTMNQNLQYRGGNSSAMSMPHQPPNAGNLNYRQHVVEPLGNQPGMVPGVQRNIHNTYTQAQQNSFNGQNIPVQAPSHQRHSVHSYPQVPVSENLLSVSSAVPQGTLNPVYHPQPIQVRHPNTASGANDIHGTTDTSLSPNPAPVDPRKIAEERISSSNGAPGSANGRSILLSCVLKCELVPFLINHVLENRASTKVGENIIASDDDENKEAIPLVKAHAAEIIKVLLMDPGYGLMFRLVVDSIPGGEKYSTFV